MGHKYAWVTQRQSVVGEAAAVKSLQSCPALCDPIDGSPPVSPVPGILQARILEWVAISFSKAWKWKVKVKSLSCVQLLATPWTAAHQASRSVGFPRQNYGSGVPLPSPVGEARIAENTLGHLTHVIHKITIFKVGYEIFEKHCLRSYQLNLNKLCQKLG